MTTDTTPKTEPSGRIDVPGFRGELIEPGDSGYDKARAVYNGAIDRRPRVIARCIDAADVMAAVSTARALGLTIAVRGGGHNAGGLGVWDDALVIDLSAMRAVHVDPAERIVRVEGGAVWGDVDHATHPFGLAVPSGFISSNASASTVPSVVSPRNVGICRRLPERRRCGRPTRSVQAGEKTALWRSGRQSRRGLRAFGGT
ncbi:FAD-binding protein [Actinophytocola sp.]|uniref:FAD-binding oxidoreductase n=1 Tax=Actinophytocola sp. TaxID=1872138 RepID=UPI0025BF72E6|nr:FAD-binding protein [Actinophytocola sp.]